MMDGQLCASMNGQRGSVTNDETPEVGGFSRAGLCRFLLTSRYETGHLSHEGIMTYIFRDTQRRLYLQPCFRRGRLELIRDDASRVFSISFS